MIYVVDVAETYYPSGGGDDWVLVTRDLKDAKARAIFEVGKNPRYTFAAVVAINEDNLHAHTVFRCNPWEDDAA